MLLNNEQYCFSSRKIIRDLVHGYVNLSSFDLDIIDSGPFQRLKDVRQLTCQQVYPSARHTRFEHSLGVHELTKRAIRNINKNGIIGIELTKKIIGRNLEFNASIAALLHDVGHCPFSHMGEAEFNKYEAQIALCDSIDELLGDSFNKELRKKLGDRKAKEIGATHELLSCAVILKHYYWILSQVDIKMGNDDERVKIDFELIIRSILGIEYDVDTLQDFEKNKLKNVIVRLINDKIFDMDKLDYIMRDSFFTGIGTPEIDTQRLFRNLYLNESGKVVFTSRAVPALQNMIEARDGLYMYVYNHHSAIYSDFIFSYIFRKLDHNVSEKNKDVSYIEAGILPREFFFSPLSVIESQYSDSDLLSNLNVQYFQARQHLKLKGVVECGVYGDDPNNNIFNALMLIKQYRERRFLKPWWKTVFEMTSFMQTHFPDDTVRKKVGQYICEDGKYGLDASEFRSQIAKHVIKITEAIFSSKEKNTLIEPLYNGDFFVVQRSNRFFALDTIQNIEIYLKKNEIIGTPTDVIYVTREYYAKSLTNIIPQKNYSSIYSKKGFYIYAKPLAADKQKQIKLNKHYETLEKIFVFVATELVSLGEQKFVETFQAKDSEILDSSTISDNEWTKIMNREKKRVQKNEMKSQGHMSKKFLSR